MDETRVSFKKQLVFTIICAIVFGLVYNGNAWYASKLVYVPSFTFSFEKHIPFMPWTIIPYLTSSIFFSTIFFFCKQKTQLVSLFKRLLFVILVAGVIYVLFPLQFSFTKPVDNNGLFQFLFQFLIAVDSPFNQAPSLHVAFAFVFWTVFRTFKTKWRSILAIWLVLLGLSTLTTYQHHVLDIVLGAILAQLSFIIFPIKSNSFQLRNFHIANHYFLGGWILILSALMLYEFCHYFYLILLWPSIVVFLIGYAYQTNNVHFLKNKQGVIPFYKKVFYAPYLMMYWMFWKFLRKYTNAIEITDNIYISSRLGKDEIQKMNFNKNTWVYDFSAELEENGIIKEKSQYFAVPLLDVGAFDVIEIERIVLEISEKHKQLPKDGKILIHCTMGFTRSTFIAILVIKNILSLPLDQAISSIKKTHKNAVIHSYLQDFLKTLNI